MADRRDKTDLRDVINTLHEADHQFEELQVSAEIYGCLKLLAQSVTRLLQVVVADQDFTLNTMSDIGVAFESLQDSVNTLTAHVELLETDRQ